MNNLSFFNRILSLSLCLIFYSCSTTGENTLPDPEIRDGVAKLSGRITNFHLIIGNRNNLTLNLLIPYPVTAEPFIIQKKSVNEDGTFGFEVLMQSNYAVGTFGLDGVRGFLVCLTAGKETKLDIIYDQTTHRLKITNHPDSLGLTATDLMTMLVVSNQLINNRPPGLTGYDKTPKEFVQRRKIILDYQLKMLAENDSLFKEPPLSEIAKNFVAKHIKIEHLDLYYFDYKRRMRVNYSNAGNKDAENFNIPELDRKYYAFLKDFNLNNPQYLYAWKYSEVLQRILSDEILNIPPIGDTPVEQWLKEVKKILSKLLGFNKGLFYDMLAANSYARQFNVELRPLSDKQRENINNYFKGKKEDFAKILLRKNEEIIRLAAWKDPLVVNEIPAVPKEDLMNTIISKYRGKVVILDFWTTWCPPCIDAMQEYRKVKGELQGRELVFVYLSNATSPQKLWEETIKGIGGEHYYIEKEDDWVFLMDTFGFNSIPSYVIFDTKGEVRHKFTGYPGNERMLAMIEKLLP